MTGQWMANVVFALSVLVWNPQGPEKPLLDYVALAKTIVLELSSRQFEKVVARFDERMAEAVPAAKLAGAWEGALAQFGPFREITGTRREEAPGYQVVYVTCAFEKANLDARMAFDAQGRVAGLLFMPSQPRVDWTAPEYVNAGAFQERAATVGSDRWQLPGTLAVPNGKGPFPALLLVHGSGPHDQDETVGANKPFKDIAWGLSSRGIVVLRYEKRTRKYGKAAMENPAGFTVNDETVDDARAGVALLATLPEVAARRIYVLGHSLGAMLAPRIAKDNPQVAGIILLAGNTRPIEELLVEQVRYIAGLDGTITEEEQKLMQATEQTLRDIRNPELKPGMMVNFLGSPIPGSYWLDLRNYRPAEAAAALRIPILVLHGERDYQIGPADFEGWKKALAPPTAGLGGHPHAVLKLYPALNHLFVAGSGPSKPEEYLKPGHVSQEVIQDIADWVLARAKERQ